MTDKRITISVSVWSRRIVWQCSSAWGLYFRLFAGRVSAVSRFWITITAVVWVQFIQQPFINFRHFYIIFQVIQSARELKSICTFNTLRPNKKAAIFQTTFSNAFSWMITNECRSRFRRSLFLTLINNMPALDQAMALRWAGNKPLPKPVMVSLLSHLYVTRPQWDKWKRCLTTCKTIRKHII